MAKKIEQNTYALVWKTTDRKFEVVRGVDPAAAMTSAGYGAGAVGALDYYVDLGPLLHSKIMPKTLLEAASFGDSGYYWKREACAKLARMCLLETFSKGAYKGWKITPLGSFLITELKLES